jgi:hypothetical protein
MAILASVFGISQGSDRQVELTWDAPTERIDGTPLPASEIVGYDLQCSNGESQIVVTGTSITISVAPSLLECSLVTLAAGDNGEVLRSEPATSSLVVVPFLAAPVKAPNFDMKVK